MASRFGKQLGGLAGLALASLIGVGAALAPAPTPPTELPPKTATTSPTTTDRHLGVGAECSRIWEPVAELAKAVREPIADTAVPPPRGGPKLPTRELPLNWRYVGLITITKADGTIVPAANVRIQGRQQFLTTGDLVPAAGSDDVEILDITPEHILIKRGEEEITIELDPDIDLMEERGFGA